MLNLDVGRSEVERSTRSGKEVRIELLAKKNQMKSSTHTQSQQLDAEQSGRLPKLKKLREVVVEAAELLARSRTQTWHQRHTQSAH